MAFTYNPGGSTNVDQVRLQIGDTFDLTGTNESLHDEEIGALVTQKGTWQASVADAARALAMKLASQPVSKTVGETQLVQKRVDFLLKKAEQWEASNNGSGVRLASPFAGGTSQADVDARNADTDRVRSAFTRPEL